MNYLYNFYIKSVLICLYISDYYNTHVYIYTYARIQPVHPRIPRVIAIVYVGNTYSIPLVYQYTGSYIYIYIIYILVVI